IIDVWFDSGTSYNVMQNISSNFFPADLYLEGSDQYISNVACTSYLNRFDLFSVFLVYLAFGYLCLLIVWLQLGPFLVVIYFQRMNHTNGAFSCCRRSHQWQLIFF
ncbi:MAG: hypothetical protein Q8877_02670, partial [Sweet potato little leaf phytoplasma]|nr:hypothetical protein [Sweet potato little leaf phytoplasma]